jgi:hypothetical protein
MRKEDREGSEGGGRREKEEIAGFSSLVFSP